MELASCQKCPAVNAASVLFLYVVKNTSTRYPFVRQIEHITIQELLDALFVTCNPYFKVEEKIIFVFTKYVCAFRKSPVSDYSLHKEVLSFLFTLSSIYISVL